LQNLRSDSVVIAILELVSFDRYVEWLFVVERRKSRSNFLLGDQTLSSRKLIVQKFLFLCRQSKDHYSLSPDKADYRGFVLVLFDAAQMRDRPK